MEWRCTRQDNVAPAVVDWYVERAFPSHAPRGLKRFIIYKLGRPYTHSGLPSATRPSSES